MLAWLLHTSFLSAAGSFALGTPATPAAHFIFDLPAQLIIVGTSMLVLLLF